MNEEKRDKTSAAENFLALIRKSRRGSFKVYIGMAAGVGKTYRMLSEARDLLELGVDVVLGFVETHNRAETQKKSEGLPIIARKKIFYKGRELEEMDLDAILTRHPEVVVVDELAHSNVPGSRNQKRYEDVEEILNAGINVISALNIQHLESLAGIVEEATGVEIHERVPDSLLKLADEVVNIDLTADDLIQRLKEGKIYAPEKVEIALQNFFQRENLLKLRELALREVANQVERKIEVEVEQPEKKQLEKILVCISSNADRAKELIRKGSRLADRLDATWYVVYVETPSENPDKINLSLQRHLINNLQTATELGASVHKIKGKNITDSILQFAEEKEISRLVIGRPNQTILGRFLKTDLLSELLSKSESTEIDIDIIA